MSLYQFALLWLVGTNLLAIVLTVSDKVRAKKANGAYRRIRCCLWRSWAALWVSTLPCA